MSEHSSDKSVFAAELLESLAHEAHVWYCNPQAVADSGRLADILSVLSDNERSQFQRFHFKNDQRNYLVSHALLRKALSLYDVETQPDEWVFETGVHGKPGINMTTSVPLQFNLTHTDGLCACVITRDLSCGIDVEQVTRNNALMPIAQRMFAGAELAILRNKADDDLRRAFFSFWTLREAYVKALGSGLSGSSKTFHFEIAGFDADDPATAVIRFDDINQSEADAWQFEIFQHDTQHVMATALHSMGEHKAIRRRYMEP
jgi:4'-phosphopantetheinyl transferase